MRISDWSSDVCSSDLLYLVATPIGNLGDISRRALDVLRRANRIACEDTRVTRKLLSAEGIATPLTAYHDHSGPRERRRLLQAVAGGQAVALVSDAGTRLEEHKSKLQSLMRFTFAV